MKWPSEWQRETRVWMMIILTGGYFFVELVVGRLTNCVALTADAFHVMSDCLALIITLISIKAAKKEKTDNFTYGWKRAELVGALVNSVFLLALCFTIAVESIHRLFLDEKIEQPVVLLVTASVGLLINLLGLVVFREHSHMGCDHAHGGHGHSHHHGHDHGHSHAAPVTMTDIELEHRYSAGSAEHRASMGSRANSTHELIRRPVKQEGHTNSQALYLHLLGDTLASVAVIIAALIMWKTTWSWRYIVDPVLSLLITGLLVKAAFPLAKKTVFIMLQGTPPTVNVDLLRKEILAINEVKAVNKLAVWQLTDVQNVGSCKVAMSVESAEEMCVVLGMVVDVFHKHGVQDASVHPADKSVPDTSCEQSVFVFGRPESSDDMPSDSPDVTDLKTPIVHEEV